MKTDAFEPVAKALTLPDGTRIVLRQPATGESPRNVFRIGSDGRIVWQITDSKDSRPQSYVDIYWKNTSRLIAYNFNGWEYQVDLETGHVKEDEFLH